MKRLLKYVLPVFLASLVVSFTANADPGPGKKKKAAAAAAAEKPEPKKKSAYEKIVEGEGVIAKKSDFISTYIQGGKLYFEIPVQYLGREMLLGTLTSETSRPGTPDQGYFIDAPVQVLFVKRDSTLLLEKKNTSQIKYPEGESYAKAIERNFMNELFRKFKIEAYNEDSTAVLINVTDLFTKDVKELSPWGKPNTVGMITDAKLVDANTTLLDTKAFSDNVMVETDMSYNVTRRYRPSSGAPVDMGTWDSRLKVKRTLALLPENKMHPRQSDRRIGIFLETGKRKVSDDKDFMQYYSLAQRWRVEPSDTTAWLRGELVEPAKQIVWYIDDAFPAEWIQPIADGILTWNKAFEKIGFKNVMVAKVFPQDDPEFDPDNIKYSCVRYIPSSIANAMGPSWTDQDTGEILNASVIVYSDISNLLYSWRMVQTGQVDPSVRAEKLPKHIFDESLQYVMAHEIGHTLGFMHNMSASSAYPTDSLRSATFTKEFGTTPSIMDYARNNYIAQPGDQGVVLCPPDLGVYDYFTVKWLYEPVIGKSEKEEKALLESWIDEKEGDPMYHYGVQQFMSYYDPRSLTEDLGDDPIKGGEYGISNLKHILPQIPSWIPNDPNNTQKYMVYQRFLGQYFGYLDNVMMVVGGININNVKDAPGVTRFDPVPKARQKEAMKWVVNQMREMDWINDTPIRYNHTLAINPSMNLTRSMMSKMLSSTITGKVVLCAHLSDDPYTLRDYSDDLYTLVFDNTIRGRKLTEGDKYMQRLLCSRIQAVVNPEMRTGMFGFTADTDISLEQLKYFVSEEEYTKVLHQLGVEHDFAHSHGDMWCSCHGHNLSGGHSFGNDSPGGMQAAGYQPQVNVDLISEWNSMLVGMIPQMETLLKTRASSGHADDRAHYRMLLNLIQKN